jgi:hypothetical protein
MNEVAPKLPNTVMFTVATAGYVPFVLNLDASLRRIGLGNQLLAYTSDSRVQRRLEKRGVRSIAYTAKRYPCWSDYGTPAFARIVAYKYEVASHILATGRNVLFVDGDIVFLRNPAAYLRHVVDQTSAPLIMQFESPKNVYNTGFWFAKPEPVVFRLFADIQNSLLVTKQFKCDQKSFNESIRATKNIVDALDPQLFACGNQFLDNISEKCAGFIARSSNTFNVELAYLLHFNYIVGRTEKAAAIKKYAVEFYPHLMAEVDKGPFPASPPISRLFRRFWSRLLGKALK